MEPCRKLWAYRDRFTIINNSLFNNLTIFKFFKLVLSEKQKEMKAKLDSLRYTRALMERQIAIQDAFLGQLPNPIQNGGKQIFNEI